MLACEAYRFRGVPLCSVPLDARNYPDLLARLLPNLIQVATGESFAQSGPIVRILSTQAITTLLCCIAVQIFLASTFLSSPQSVLALQIDKESPNCVVKSSNLHTIGSQYLNLHVLRLRDANSRGLCQFSWFA